MRAAKTASRSVAIGAMLLLLAACSGASSSPVASAAGPAKSAPPSLSADAPSCALLTQQEVADALTQTLTTPQGTSGEPAECRYVNAGGFGLTVEISHSTSPAADLAAHKATHGARASDLPGIGDAAFEVTGQRIIEFTKGNTIVNLYTEERTDVLTPDEFHALATAAASRVK